MTVAQRDKPGMVYPPNLPNIVPTSADEQLVVLMRGAFIKDGKPVVGPVLETHGGIAYTIGVSGQIDFRDDKPERVRRILELQKLREQGLVDLMTPGEVFERGVNGDRTKIGVIYTSGGESSPIGPNVSTVAGRMSDTHVVLGAWQGFKPGMLPREQFKRTLLVLNDPRVIERMSRLAGSPFGMSRAKLEHGKPTMDDMLANSAGLGFVYGTGGGDHTRNFKTLWKRLNSTGLALGGGGAGEKVPTGPLAVETVSLGAPTLGTRVVEAVSPGVPTLGAPAVVCTTKSMDNDWAAILEPDGSMVFSLMMGYPSAAYAMRKRFFTEMQSAAGAGRGFVAFLFSRGAGHTVIGAVRCDDEYKEMMRRDGILTPTLEAEMDSFGGGGDPSKSRIIGLVPEVMVSIPDFVEKVNEVYHRGRDRTVGIAVSEGFMFKELNAEYTRLQREVNELKARLKELYATLAPGKQMLEGDVKIKMPRGTITFKREALGIGDGMSDEEMERKIRRILEDKISRGEIGIKDESLKKVFEAKPEIAREFFKLIVNPDVDVWGHPRIEVVPKIVDAVVNVLTDVKNTNYAEIKYEARTPETIPSDRIIAVGCGELAAEKLKAGESGIVIVPYQPGEDPLLIDVRERKPVFIPWSQIKEITEKDNNLQPLIEKLGEDYLRKCNIFIP